MRRSASIIAIFTLFYIPYVCARAALKPLWFDELSTLLVARLGSVSEIMHALGSGVDAQPPLLFILSHWTLQIGGNELICGRIPGMIGFLLMCVCLFLFAARRGPTLLAILVMVVPLTTGLFYYATEARPYGLVLGFAALALLAWSSLPASGHRRLFNLFLLWCALSMAMFSHYYTVLLPIMLLTGEAVRMWLRRRIDWGSMIAIGASYVSFLCERPIIAAQTARLGVHWAKPSLWTAIEFYNTALTPLLLPALLVIVAVALYEWNSTGNPAIQSPSVPLDELVVIFMFFLLPFMAYMVGVFVTGSYTGRYSISVLIGIALLFWWLIQRSFRPGSGSSLIALICMFAVLGVDEYRYVRRAFRTDWSTLLKDDFPFSFDGNLPIVVHDARDFLPMLHYAPPQLARRLVYLADPKLSLQYSGSVGLDVTLQDLVPWVPMQVLDFRQFEADHRRFLLFWGKPEESALVGWQFRKLREDGARLSVVEEHSQRVLFEVSLPN